MARYPGYAEALREFADQLNAMASCMEEGERVRKEAPAPAELVELSTGPNSAEGRLRALEDRVSDLHDDIMGLQADLAALADTASDLASKEALHRLARDLRAEFGGKSSKRMR